jgi:hypothetical protein
MLLQQQTNTGADVATNTMAVLLYSIMWQIINQSMIWIIIALFIIAGDLFFGIKKSGYLYKRFNHKEDEVKFWKALKRTISKICEYMCWIMIAISLGIGFKAPWIKYVIFIIVYGYELSSCFRNYFLSKGKEFHFNLRKFLLKRLGFSDAADDITINDIGENYYEKNLGKD